jgi:Cu-processing system permease protein
VKGYSSTFRVSAAIARVTLWEILRDKVLYNVLLCGVLLMGLSFTAAQLSFMRQDRLLTDFGISGINLSCAMIAIFTGAAMIGREFERRTVFVALSRPISRYQFILGKFLGLAGVIALNWLMLSAAFLIILKAVTGDGFAQAFNPTLVTALVLLLAQSLLLGSISVFFSSFSTTSLSAIMTIGVYLIGNNISQIRFLATKSDPALASLLNGLSLVLPNLEYFNLGTKASYGIPISSSFLLGSGAYFLVTVSTFLILAGLLIQKREA